MAGIGRFPGDSRGGWRAAYFAFQSMATVSWWLLMAASPAWRRWFAFGDDGASLLQFLPGDTLFWILGSLIAAWGDWIGASWRVAVRHAVGGAVACSFVHAASAAAITGSGAPGVLLMMPAVLLTGFFSWFSKP